MSDKYAKLKLKKLAIEQGEVTLVDKDKKTTRLKKLGLEKGRFLLKLREGTRKTKRKKLVLDKGVLRLEHETKGTSYETGIEKGGKTIRDCDNIKEKKYSGGRLGDALICCVSLRDDIFGFDEIECSKQALLSLDGVTEKIEKGMNVAYAALVKYMERKIDTWTPKDVGRLRKSSHESISPLYSVVGSDRPNDPILTVWFHQRLPYAKIVDKMPTKGAHPHVRHPPYPAKYSWKTKKKLYDPQALGGNYRWIVLNSRKKAWRIIVKHLMKPLKKFLKQKHGVNMKPNQTSSMFKIRPWSSVGRKINV